MEIKIDDELQSTLEQIAADNSCTPEEYIYGRIQSMLAKQMKSYLHSDVDKLDVEGMTSIKEAVSTAVSVKEGKGIVEGGAVEVIGG
jgi:hypothetical protein